MEDGPPCGSNWPKAIQCPSGDQDGSLSNMLFGWVRSLDGAWCSEGPGTVGPQPLAGWWRSQPTVRSRQTARSVRKRFGDAPATAWAFNAAESAELRIRSHGVND